MRLKEIKAYVKKIKREFKVKTVILFGSHALNKITEESDVDLLIIMDTNMNSIKQAVEIRKKIPASFPLDLIVRKPEEIEDRLRKGDFFFKKILSEGEKL